MNISVKLYLLSYNVVKGMYALISTAG